jgi:hypothetical protein
LTVGAFGAVGGLIIFTSKVLKSNIILVLEFKMIDDSASGGSESDEDLIFGGSALSDLQEDGDSDADDEKD